MGRVDHDKEFASAVSIIQKTLQSAGEQRVALYGAGQHSKDLLKTPGIADLLNKANFAGFISDDPAAQGTLCANFPVVSPDVLIKDPVEILIFSSDYFEHLMRQKALETGYSGSLVSLYEARINTHNAHGFEVLALDRVSQSVGLDFEALAESAGISYGTIRLHQILGTYRVQAEEWMQEHQEVPLEDLSLHGRSLLELARGSAACLLNRAEIDLDKKQDRTTIRAIITECIAYYNGICDILNRPNSAVKTLLLFNGYWHGVRSAALAAIDCGVRVLSSEISFFPGLVYVEHLRYTVANDTALADLSLQDLKLRQLRPDQKHLVEKFFHSRTPRSEKRIDRITQPEAMPAEALREQLGISPDKKIMLAIMQVVSDTTIVFDNPLYGNNIDFIADTLKWIQSHPDWHLIIKPHPKEAEGSTPVPNARNVSYEDITFKRLETMLAAANVANVSLVNGTGVNTYSLFELADIGVTINSQAGLEMMANTGKRIVVFGKAVYGGKGFTIDVNHRQFIDAALTYAAEHPQLNTQEYDRMLTFLYVMIFEYLYPTNLAEDPLRCNRLTSLLAGGNVSASSLFSGTPKASPPSLNSFYAEGENLLKRVAGFKSHIHYKRTYQFFDGEEPHPDEQYAEQGTQRFEKGNYREASILLDRAVSMNPENIPLRNLAVLAKYRMGDAFTARSMLKSTLMITEDAIEQSSAYAAELNSLLTDCNSHDVSPAYFGPPLLEEVDLVESILSAGETFTLLELGAGFGRWVAYANAMLQVLGGSKKSVFTAVEAEPGHLEFLREHMHFNNIQCSVIPAAVAGKDGRIQMSTGNPFTDYGRGLGSGREVDAVSLDSLLEPLEYVDLIEADLQGAEQIVFPTSRLLHERVRKVQVATHRYFGGKTCESHEKMRAFFKKAGWVPVSEYHPYTFSNTYMGMMRFVDGMQVWVNPKFIA